MEESSSKWVENTVGKGEIARYEQFLLFPQCFQKASFPGASKDVVVWEWVKPHQCIFYFCLWGRGGEIYGQNSAQTNYRHAGKTRYVICK